MGRYIALRMDGSKTTHASAEALKAARKRAKGPRTIVDSWPESDPPPAGGDARAWDDYRNRRGYAGGR
jgi:hypothetical protein